MPVLEQSVVAVLKKFRQKLEFMETAGTTKEEGSRMLTAQPVNPHLWQLSVNLEAIRGWAMARRRRDKSARRGRCCLWERRSDYSSPG